MNVKSKNALGLLLTLGVAGVIAVILIATRQPVEHVAAEMPHKTVEVISAGQLPFRAQVTAYGLVEPAITLNSMAEVSGRISYVHPNLKSGETIPVGTVVVRIDAEDYAITLQQTQEDLRANRSSLQELNEEQKSTERSLKLAQQNLEVGEAEFARVEDIYEKRLIAKSALDAEEQKVISLRQQLVDLQGRLNGFASRRQSIEAQIARAEQEVQNRATILGRTEIGLPFSARIGAVNVDQGEFVSVGTPLFEAIDLQGVEITAQLPMTSMRKLVSHLEGSALAAQQLLLRGGRINDRLQLGARVRLVNDFPEAQWDARVLRISEAIDPTRQTLGIVVGVDAPFEKVIPGRRPPLIKGMYTAVELHAPLRPAMVIPRKALHQGRVYLADGDNRLRIRALDIQLTQGDLAVVRNGLSSGERVIITDLSPVIEGMPLDVRVAADFAVALQRRAAGALP